MAWYSSGTVSVTNGSAVVTGSGTNFILGLQRGWALVVNSGDVYEIASVDSATSLTLAEPYLGPTQSGMSYKAFSTQSLAADLATSINTLISDFQGVFDGPGQGKFLNGTAAAPSFTFQADQDTGIFRPAPDMLGFATGGAERVRIDSAGRVGFGVTTPTEKVDVAGNVKATGDVEAGGNVAAGGDVAATGNVTGANLDIANWNAAHGWGNHAQAGYMPKAGGSFTGSVDVTGDVDATGDVTATGNVTGANLNVSDWDAAHGWGDHGQAGYMPQAGGAFSGGVQAQSFDLMAFAADMGIDAIGGFLYDTTTDYMGGLWRYQCKGCTWQREEDAATGRWLGYGFDTVGQALAAGGVEGDYFLHSNGNFYKFEDDQGSYTQVYRGSREDAPARAILILTEEQLIIFDGDDPTFPLWKRCLAGSGVSRLLARGSGPSYPTSLVAKNGSIYIGVKGATSSTAYDGFVIFNLPADRAERYSSSGAGYVKATYGLANCNSQGYPPERDDNRVIGNNQVNDIAVTTRRGAPIDPATGLPKPVIALGTEDGVYVILEDGRVVEVSYIDSSKIYSVDFAGDLLILNANRFFHAIPIPDDDYTSAVRYSKGVRDVWFAPQYHNPGVYVGGSFELRGIASSPGAVIQNGDRVAIANTDRLNLAVVQSVYGKGNALTASVSSKWSTGWMLNPLGCWGADTETSDVTDTPLNANADFSGGSTGWDVLNDTVSFSGGTVAFDPLELDVIFPYVAVTEIGEEAHIRIVVDSISTGHIGVSYHTASITPGDEITAPGTYQFKRPVSGNDRVYLRSENSDAVISEFAILPLIADRSVNLSGLSVVGTVLRAPVAPGAELSALTGITPANYPYQPYRSYFDVGADDDLAIMLWFKPIVGTGYPALLCRNTATAPETNLGAWNLKVDRAAKKVYLAASGSNRVMSDNTYVTDAWNFVCLVRKEGRTELTLNGITTVGEDAGDLTLENALLYVGVSTNNGNRTTSNADLALIRIGKDAPTAEQIATARRDERKLFLPGAKATLPADPVMALDYCEVTGLHYIGTSGGMAVMDGLEVVEKDTTPVAKFISASNGLIVRQ